MRKLKHRNNIILLLSIAQFVLFTSCNNDDTDNIGNETSFLRSIDLSIYPEIEKENILFKDSLQQKFNLLSLLKKSGYNNIRLRLWVNPTDKKSSFKEVKRLSEELREMGFSLLLSVHFSNSWADPSKQTKPVIWQNIGYNALLDSVFNYSKKGTEQIKPDFFQIGNETNSGLLWPAGHLYNKPLGFINLATAINNGAKAGNNSTKTIVHLAGHNNYYDLLSKADSFNYDFVGISYYPWWHGTDTTELKINLNTINRTFNRKIFIVETGYPFRTDWNDQTHNLVGENAELINGWEANKKGQFEYIKWLKNYALNSSYIMGISYWEGAWTAFNGPASKSGSPWENCALFDYNNQATPAFYELGKE